MASRPSRSSSIPIPRSTVSTSPTRNIESVISIPFSTSPALPRPRLPGHGFPSRTTGGDDHRGVSFGAHGNSSVAASPTIRPTARSFTQSSAMASRNSPHTYEPRIIRADSLDNGCVSSSTSPTRQRRQSGPGVRAPSTQRPSAAQPPAYMQAAPSTTFPRPAYLNHSTLRHLLQTESFTPLPSTGRTEPVRVDQSGTFTGRSRRRSPSSDSDEDDASPPREQPPSIPSSLLSPSPILRLPTRWSDEYRHSLLTVTDGRELVFQGASTSTDKDAATARTIYPIPPACGVYYYEVEITSKGNKGNISIGFVGRDFKVSRLPGWEKNSWGYHGDDGSSFAAEKSGTPYGPQFGAGDIIGCGIDFSQYRAFYTRNGTLLGMVFDNVGRDCDLYPAVGLCHSGESIRANFGHEPFRYAIEDHVRRQQNVVWSKIQCTQLKWPPISGIKVEDDAAAESSKDADSLAAEERVKVPINQLVLSYLSHHGYARSARAFEAQCKSRGGLSDVDSLTRVPLPVTYDHGMDMDDLSSAEPPEGDIELRTRIVRSVTTGDIDAALTETQKHFPSVLEREQGLMLFKLRCRKFVELVLEAAELKKKMKAEEFDSAMEPEQEPESDAFMDEMDIDDGIPSSLPSGSLMNGNGASSAAIPIKAKRKQSFPSFQHSWESAIALQYGFVLEKAFAYGEKLQSDYKDQPEKKAIFKRTSVILAYDDPLGACGDCREVAGQGARVALATELNQAILQSQGHPTHPALEKLYRQTAACVVHLALLGVGSAAFADMPKEFLDS